MTNSQAKDMQNHLVGAMAKAELEASQRLMSVLPYKTGQVMSRPQSSTVNRRTTVDRHSFALGDTEEYSRLFGNSAAVASGRNSDLLMNHSRSSSPYVNSLLDDTSIVAGNNNASTTSSNGRRLVNGSNGSRGGASGRAMFNNAGRPHSVIEGDTTSLFPTASSSANWLTPTNSTTRRTTPTVGHIGDRSSKMERPKSADISNWSLPTTTTTSSSATSNDNRSNGYQSVWGAQQRQLIPELDNDLIEFSQQQQQPFRRRANMNRIPVVPESDELVRATQDLFISDTFHKPIINVNPPLTTTSTSSSLDPYGNFVMNSRPTTSIVDNSSSSTNNITHYNNNNHNLNVLDEPDYASDHSEGSNMSRRRSSSMTPNARATKDKKAVEVIDMELLKGKSGY